MPNLDDLVRIFYTDARTLGRFSPTQPGEMPPAYAELLAHDDHMTVTVEAFHRTPVDVQVLDSRLTPPFYSRKILLKRQSDGQVVQFGIVRLDFRYLEPEVQEEILATKSPLGRILIQHDVMRKVELVELWRVEAGPDLAACLKIQAGDTVYGRTALIHCNGEPAVELLEIVTP
jgi:chorismate-pyruvate lyase